jgi:hypothetical protein
MAFPDVPVAGGIGVVTFPVVPIDIPQDVSPTPGDPTPPASQFDVGQWAWSTWGEYGGYVVQGVGVGLIVVDILNTPISPTPDLGIIGAAMIARGVSARTVGHHADPRFLGGAANQSLTRLAEGTHKNLHRDLNDFLRTRTDQFGNHMRPQRGNSGQDIRQNFSRQERLEALRDFYRGPGAKYTDAARDFFRQHPGL